MMASCHSFHQDELHVNRTFAAGTSVQIHEAEPRARGKLPSCLRAVNLDFFWRIGRRFAEMRKWCSFFRDSSVPAELIEIPQLRLTVRLSSSTQREIGAPLWSLSVGPHRP
jgi:hypothetical protein